MIYKGTRWRLPRLNFLKRFYGNNKFKHMACLTDNHTGTKVKFVIFLDSVVW